MPSPITVTLADKPRDLLVLLVDRGPLELDEIRHELAMDGHPLDEVQYLHAGGLSLLSDLGLAESRRVLAGRVWEATDEGRALVARARGEVAHGG